MLRIILSVVIKGMEGLVVFPFLHSKKSSQNMPTMGISTIRIYHPFLPISCKRRMLIANEGIQRVNETNVNNQP